MESLRRFLPVLVAFMAGCASPNRSFWSELPDGQGKALIPSEVDPKFYPRLRIIEFDEQGDFWNRSQVAEAKRMIKRCQKPPILIVYIHGWQNNANPENSDLKTFNDFLKRLNGTGVGRKFDICGVFIGWRGEGVRREAKATLVGYLPYYGTFWSRKSATERVAGIPLSRTLTELSVLTHSKEGGKVILIGHSFGGRILERTFGQWLAIEGSRVKPGASIHSPADLLVLINPASESLYALELKLALSKVPRSARPAVVSLTSESDSATKERWSQSAWLSALVKGSDGYRTYHWKGIPSEGQYSYIASTAGHDERQFTHKIEKLAEIPTVKRDSFLTWNLSHSSMDHILIRTKDGVHVYRVAEIPENESRGSQQLPFGGYWVIKVPDEILHQHGGIYKEGGIFNESVTDLLGAIVKVSETSTSSEPPTIKMAPISPDER